MESFKEYTTEELIKKVKEITGNDFSEDFPTTKVGVVVVDKYNREIRYTVNGILRDSVMIGIETEECFDEEIFTVITWNNAFSDISPKKDMEFKNFQDARKEMRARCIRWQESFNRL